MDDPLHCQASSLTRLLPQLMRRLFPLHGGDPGEELPLAQLRMCTVLQSGPRSMSAVGDELGISPSAVTQVADRLEDAGMVERVTEPDDRRVRQLRLTPHGDAAMCARATRRVERAARVLAALDEPIRAQVLAGIVALLDAAEGVASEAAPAVAPDASPPPAGSPASGNELMR